MNSTPVTSEILILQLCEAERGDLIAPALERAGFLPQRIRADIEPILPDPAVFSAAIILGSPTSVNEYQSHDWARRLFDWTARALREDLPILGLCYGSQLLAKIMGGTVYRHERMELGIFEASLTDAGKADPLFSGFPATFTVAHWHGDTWNVPFGATLLCTGADCPHQAFRRGRQLGLQFHLECSAEELRQWPADYPGDVATTTKDAAGLIREFSAGSAETSRLFGKLLENWLQEISR